MNMPGLLPHVECRVDPYGERRARHAAWIAQNPQWQPPLSPWEVQARLHGWTPPKPPVQKPWHQQGLRSDHAVMLVLSIVVATMAMTAALMIAARPKSEQASSPLPHGAPDSSQVGPEIR
jgi:hypothetical protein